MKLDIIKQNHAKIMCNSAHDILICMLSDTTHACALHLDLEHEFKEIGQNLRKFGSSKKEFQFQAVEALIFHEMN